MSIAGLHIIDVIVIVLYFAFVLCIGYRAMKKVKNTEDFFLGGRQFGKFFQTFSQFGQATSTESVVQTVSAVGSNGLAGAVSSSLGSIIAFPLAWIYPKWLRRLRLMSMADYFIDRFNCKKLAALYALAQAFLFIMVGGMGLTAMSKTVCVIAEKPVEKLSIVERTEYDQAIKLEALEAKPVELLTAGEAGEMKELRQLKPRKQFSYINRKWLVIAMAIFILLYAAGGGLEAAVYTDAMQSVFIIILTLMLIPFAMLKLNAISGTEGLIGPFTALHQILPESLFEIFGSPKWVELKWYNLVLLLLIGAAGGIAYSNNLVVSGSAKDEEVARFGGMSGSIIKGFSNFFWILLAMLILGIFGDRTTDSDLMWGMAAKTLLPVGLLGLMMACLLAALMSTADTHMMTVSGLLTNNIYKPFIKGRSESHYINAGRILGVVYISGAVMFALGGGSIWKMWKFMILINACCGPPMLMGFLWRRTNAKAVWAAMGVSLTMTLFIPFFVTLIPAVKDNPAFHQEAQSVPVVKVYTASQRDVKERADHIAQWNALNAQGKAKGRRPDVLAPGQEFEKTFAPAPKAIFWDEGLKKEKDGTVHGVGFFKADLYLLHCLGVNLSSYSPAVVEFFSLLFKLLFPFIAVFAVGFLTKPQDKTQLDLFYAKLRTPVGESHEADEQAMVETAADPGRFDHVKLLPESNWEFDRQTARDWKGIIIGALAGTTIVGLIILLANLGR